MADVNKRFSVIIPTYTRQEYVRQAIDSVLAQTFKDYELIVIDDGSTDRTWDVLQSYGAQIKTIHQINHGYVEASKAGVSLANGEYLAFLDDDDRFLPEALEIYDKIIRALDSPPVIIGAMKTFRQDLEFKENVGSGGAIEVLKYRNYLSKDIGIGLSQSRIVMKKALFEGVYGPGDGATSCTWIDYNLMLQTGIYGPCVIVKSPTTVAYRLHGHQLTENLEKSALGIFSLIHTIRRGRYPGWRSHFLGKYAFAGGPVYEWSRKALQGNRPGLAFRILLNGWPMVVAAIIRKFLFLFQRPTTPLTIVNE